MPEIQQKPQIKTRTEYAVLRAKCTPRYVEYIATGDRKGTGPVGKKVQAALHEYDTILAECETKIAAQLQKPLQIPASSS